jgi:hypothetical protein
MDVYDFIMFFMSPSSSTRVVVAEENNTSVLEGGRGGADVNSFGCLLYFLQ